MAGAVKTPLRGVDELRITAAGLDHPEAAAWFDGALWCGTEAGDLLRINAKTGVAEAAARTGGFLLGVAFDKAGTCFACDLGRNEVLRIDADGAVEVVAHSVEGRKLQSPNFSVFSPDGTLWVTESGTGWGTDDGYLFRIDPDGRTELAADDCRLFPNGLALSADGGTLYLIESRLPGVVTYTLSGREIGERSVHLMLPGTVPDGLALDSIGALYISCWRPDRVYRLNPDGELNILLDDPTGEFLTTPTNLCFGGADLRTLYFASLGGWSIRELAVEVPGQPLTYP
jgi:sugar lactone lactonase YvrE